MITDEQKVELSRDIAQHLVNKHKDMKDQLAAAIGEIATLRKAIVQANNDLVGLVTRSFQENRHIYAIDISAITEILKNALTSVPGPVSWAEAQKVAIDSLLNQEAARDDLAEREAANLENLDHREINALRVRVAEQETEIKVLTGERDKAMAKWDMAVADKNELASDLKSARRLIEQLKRSREAAWMLADDEGSAFIAARVQLRELRTVTRQVLDEIAQSLATDDAQSWIERLERVSTYRPLVEE